jgi:WD40 repeat protein
VKIWDNRTRKLIDTLRDKGLPLSDDFDSPTKGLAFSPDGTRIAVGVGRAVVIWTVASRQHIALTNAHTQTVNYLAFAPGGKILASGADDNVVKLWDITSAEPRQMVALPVGFGVLGLAFSYDGTTLAAAICSSPIKRWNVLNPEAPVEMPPLVGKEGHSSWVMAIAFSPRTNILVSAGSGGDLIAWDRATDPQAFYPIRPAQLEWCMRSDSLRTAKQ